MKKYYNNTTLPILFLKINTSNCIAFKLQMNRNLRGIGVLFENLVKGRREQKRIYKNNSPPPHTLSPVI